MKEREYRRLRSEIEADYRRKLEALELIYAISNSGAPQAEKPPESKGALAEAVAKAASQMNGNFNVRNIENAIKVFNPVLAANVKRASISNTLKRMEATDLEVVERGSGKRATTYRKRVSAKVG